MPTEQAESFDRKDLCFLCGSKLSDDPSQDVEHIFPQWVLKRFGKAGQFAVSAGDERQRQRFYSHICTVHRRCNHAFASGVEEPVSQARYDDRVLWIWCLKIIIGLRFYQYGFATVRSDSSAPTNATLDDYPDDAESFWALSAQLIYEGEFINTPIFTVIELDFLFDAPQFYYVIHDELGVMWLVLGERAFLVFFRSFLGVERVSEYQQFWTTLLQDAKIRGEDSEPQLLYNVFSARVAIDHYFKGAGWSFDFSGPDTTPTPTRPPRSPEIEDGFYRVFGLHPVREGGKIIAWRTGENAININEPRP